jgi:TP901 family phage tail tape measure protein
VKFRLGATITDLQSQMRAATRAVEDFSKKSVAYIERNSASIDDLSNKVGGVGVSLVALATAAVTRFAQFDKAMSAVAATGDDARGSLDDLRAAAINAGADTAYSAEEAANAIEEMAKAGVSAKDILGGGLTGALSLAAAGGLDVAQAAEIAATALTQFNLEGSELPHVADLLAAGAGKAQGGVSDMANALKYAGVPLAQLGVSIEETAGSIALFASNGILGEQAGTSLRSIISSLTSPSAAAAGEMERLGINVFDAQDEFIGLEGVAGQLHSRLGSLTEAERAAALGRIFGNESLQAANVLYAGGAIQVRHWTDAVNEQGYAAETARVQTDNLLGDLERLGGSLDSVFIQGGTSANQGLRGIVQGAEAVVDAVGRIPEPVLSATTVIAGAGGLALLGVAGMGKLAVSVSEVTEALRSMNVPMKSAAAAAGGLGVVLAGVGIGLSIMAQRAAESQGRVQQLTQTWDEAGRATIATTNLISESLTKSTDNVADGNRTVLELAKQVGVSTQDLIGYIEGEADARERVNQTIAEHYDVTEEWLGQALTEQTEANNLSKELDDLAGEYGRSKEEAALQAEAQEAAASATSDMSSATQDATGAIQENTQAVEDQWQAMMDASGSVLSLRDAQRQAEAAYDDARAALEENGATLNQATAKGRANQAALDGIASAGYDLVDSLRASGASLGDVQGAMATARKRFIETATAMGMGRREARALADQLGLIPANVTTNAVVNTGNALAQVATLDNTLNRIDGKTVTASVAIKQYGQAAMATGGRLTGFPTGGRLPGSPPANPMQDNLLGVDGSGMPRVLVRSREWVINEGASDYYGDPLMSAINSRAISREALAGMVGLAGGGAVGAAQDAVTYWWGQVAEARDSLRSARRRKSERAEREAEARLERARDRLDAAQERRDRLREEAADLRTSLRRGEVRDQVTGGLSGAYSATDQLREMANSGDLGSARSRRLRNVAGRAENELRSLYNQAERAEKKIASTRDRLEELLQVQSQVRSDIVGGFSLSSVVGEFDPKTGKRAATGSQLAAAAKAYAGKAKKFAGLLSQLGSKTNSAAVVTEVAGYGVEQGTALAESLLADLPSLRSLASSYAAIEKYGGWAGAAVARSVGGGQGISEAQQAVKSAEAQAAAIDKRIGKWGRILGQEMARALGIKARADGGSYNAGDFVLTGERGPELEYKATPGYVLTAEATRRLAATSPTGYGAPSVTHLYNSNLSVTTNRDVTPDALLRFEKKRRLLEVRR